MAAEWGASAAANTAGNLATECLSPYINYFFHFRRIVEEFKDLREKLKIKKERLQDGVNEAERQSEVIYEDVKLWLTRAKRELGEAQSLEDEIERNKCFSWCPSWGWRYCLSMKVAKKSICIKKLIDTCNFERLGQRPPLQGIEFFPSKDFKASESSTVAFNAIIKALTTDGVNMIGMYGMPGVGKTTLAKEVGKYAREQKIFDKVVMVTMSQTPSISNVQDRIAEILGLEFKATTEKGKAEELWRILKGEKILIIIDDVWKEFKLETIRIPCDGENDGCKILLTTRVQEVCDKMNCQQKFKLKILLEDEAWALFKLYAGLEEDLSRPTTKLIEVAKELARECQGLPLAIKGVARALKGKNLTAWETANRKLKDSRHLENEGVTENIYTILRVSYDFLTEDNTKSCFLLCSLFPEDDDISIDCLALIAIGEGLFCNAKLMKEQRDEIRLALEVLQQSGLLLEIDDKENTVRMHDVVRDFAHWLTSKGDAKFMVRTGLTKWPMNESFESHTAIALWDFNMNSFPDKIEFKNLKTLILQGQAYPRLTIPDPFFEEMKELQVLWLEGVEFSLEALRFLTNLRALLLFDCKLINKNISSLINSEKLEIFYVDHIGIDELSEELERLGHLKYLYIRMDIKFPSKLLSRLTSLQELHILGGNNINSWELSSLSCLSALSLRISPDNDYQCFEEGFVFPKTQSYSIAVNLQPKDMEGQGLRILKISNFSSSLSPFKKLLGNMDELILRNVYGDKYIFSNEEARELTELTYLQLDDCKDQEYLIEPAQNHANTSTSLQSLNLHHHLHENAITSLQSLKDIEISRCRKLKSIFSHCVVQNLLHLQQLSISECNKLEQVFCFAENHGQIVEEDENLHHHHHGNASTSLQSLKLVDVKECPTLKSIFPPFVTHNLFHLQLLRVRGCDELEQVFAFAENDVQIIEQHQNLHHHLHGNAITTLQSLKDVEIVHCSKLKSIFSHCVVQNLLHLQKLIVNGCYELEQVFAFAETHGQIVEEDEVNQLRVLSNLNNLKLTWLPNLRYIWPGSTYRVYLSSLNILEIFNCHKLEFLFSSSLARTLMHLEHVSIESCNSLEHLISIEVENEDAFCWPKVITLKIESCKSLKDVFPITLAQGGLPALRKIEIMDCPQLMGLFSVPKESDEFTPRLQFLKSQSFTNLTSFSLEDYFEILPSLTEFQIKHINYGLHYSAEKHSGVSLNQFHLRNYKLYKVERFICNAQHVKLESVIYDKNLVPNLNKLSSLIINDSDELEQVFTFAENHGQIVREDEENQLQVLSNLTNLKLEFFPKLRCIWSEPTDRVNLSSLNILEIYGCDKLKCLFSSSLARTLIHLEHVSIGNCESLEHLISTEVENEDACCWPKFNTLKIYGCKSLKDVFSITLSQDGLAALKKIAIIDCPQLMGLFSVPKESDELPPHLQFLKSQSFTNFTSFSPEDYFEILPSLTEFQIKHINYRLHYSEKKHSGVSLNQFHLRDYKLYKFERFICNAQHVKLECVIYDKNLVPNLNKLSSLIIEGGKGLECLIDTMVVHDQALLLSNLRELKLISLPELKCLWKGPTHNDSLSSLKVIEICQVNGLKSLLSPMLARNLQQLTNLWILKCDELEEIIDTSSASSSYSQADTDSEACLPHISFPSLERIEIVECNNLKSLFPVSVISSLSKIKAIEIDGACKLEQVFKYEAEVDVNQDDQNHKRKIVLPPSFQRFRLLEVSGLRSLAPMGCHFLFPSTCFIRIRGYSNLITSFSRDSKGIVHAITQAQPSKHFQNDVEGDYDNETFINSCTDLPLYKEEEESG